MINLFILKRGELGMNQCEETKLIRQKEELVKNHLIYLFIKRLMDIVGASIGIILTAPIMLVVAILVKLEDPKLDRFFFHK